MKIESSSNDALARLQPGAARATSNAEAQDAGAAVQKAGVTSASSSIVSLSTLGTATGSDIDTATVESIKAALRDGSYRIDSSRIADGMMNTARDLLQTRTR